MRIIPYIKDDTFLGGHLLGGVDTSYKNIVAKFGKPNEKNDGYKTDAEWLIMTDKGHATIYNYKDGKNYLGKEGLNKTDITEWHIGGENQEVADIINDYLMTI